MKRLFYFGCIREPGHYLWESDRNHANERHLAIELDVNPSLFRAFDSIFAPSRSEREFLYQESLVPPPFRIIAWWDRTGDPRHGSNSAIIGIGFDSAEEMIDEAIIKFPTPMNRQPRPKPIIP